MMRSDQRAGLKGRERRTSGRQIQDSRVSSFAVDEPRRCGVLVSLELRAPMKVALARRLALQYVGM